MIVVRGRSKSPWLLNYSHRTSGDLSVMVSVFLGVSGCCCVTRDVQKNDIDVACRLSNFSFILKIIV